MSSPTLKVEVNIDPAVLTDKVTNLLNDSSTMLEIHNLFAKMCDPYVPFLEGPLSQTVNITPEYVQYIQPYAHYQYVGIYFNHTIDYHPLASALWDKAMMATHREEFELAVRDILVRRAQKLYG